MKKVSVVVVFLATALLCCLLTPGTAWSAPTCPLSSGYIDTAKSHKLFLYFPTADDSTFPNYGSGVSPAKTFDVADLDSSIGTTSDLINRIYDVVADDYCELNVQVVATTTNPETMQSPPARRNTVAIGSDSGDGWGLAQVVDTGDDIDVDFARVWGGTYITCEGGNKGAPGCSMTGALTGANSTLDRWANAIGGTAAHEAGHSYGLSHLNDNPNPGTCVADGPMPLPGEDSYERHLMPAGCNLNGEDRAGYRRHLSDRTFGILATNLGLSIETMHNWDLVNPNAEEAHSLEIEFLSKKPSLTVGWTWTGSSSPWIDPVVTGPLGTTMFKGTTYNRYRITWSSPNPTWIPTPGILPGGAEFHIGATFTGVDFNQPDAIIIQNIRLFDAGSDPLTLHPRLPGYDAGTVDAADGSFDLNFFGDGTPLILQEATVFQLPRVAAMESLIGSGSPFTFNGMPIVPWSATRCEPGTLRDTLRCTVANVADRPHVEMTLRVGDPGVYDCSRGVPTGGGTTAPRNDHPFNDYEGPICAGTSRDPFPSTTVYVIATFVDPQAEHWNPEKGAMVIGPVTTKVFYQFAGVRDLRSLRPTTEGGTTTEGRR
ncbi:MAG TPA: hypothetical protein VF756_17620 [Thermoanaerobaculia bacterium]